MTQFGTHCHLVYSIERNPKFYANGNTQHKFHFSNFSDICLLTSMQKCKTRHSSSFQDFFCIKERDYFLCPMKVSVTEILSTRSQYMYPFLMFFSVCLYAILCVNENPDGNREPLPLPVTRFSNRFECWQHRKKNTLFRKAIKWFDS